MLFVDITKIELTGGHIGIMLFIEVENLEFPGGHIEIGLFVEMEKCKISRRPYWNYAIYIFAN